MKNISAKQGRRKTAGPLYLAGLLLFCAASAAAAGVDYTARIEGIPEKRLRNELEANAYLFQFIDNKPLSLQALRRRASDDMDRLRDVMIGRAHYGADIRYRIAGEQAPYAVTVDIDAGPVFSIASYDIAWENLRGQKSAAPKGLDVAAVPAGVTGKAATLENILAAERDVLEMLRENGYPLPAVTDRKVVVDHATRTARVSLAVRAGRHAVFGATETTGNQTIDPAFVSRRIGWEEGDEFNIGKVTSTRQNLLKTGLFSSVDMALAARDGARTVPVTIEMTERKPRTIGAGLSYSTSRSLGGKAFWEHRNIFGAAEKLRLEAEAGMDYYGAEAGFTKPDFGGTTRRTLQLKTGYKQEFLDAYDKTGYTLFGGLNHAFNDRLSLSLGGGAEFTQIKEKNLSERDFTMVSVPASLKYDSSDDALDPTRGWRAHIAATPYVTLNQSNEMFTVAEVAASHYLPFNDGKFVFANRLRLGAILGESTAAVPADKRLFAGGGGSVRGYGYQLISPLDANDDPTGGRLLVEAGSEMRMRVTEDIGLAGFVEGARVTEEVDFGGGDEDFLWAAGIGARYYTAVGPVRVDIATPLNGRDKDDVIQFYFSLGQAF